MIYLFLYAIIAAIICTCAYLSCANNEDKILGIIIFMILFAWLLLPLALLMKLCQIKIK